MQTQSDTWTGLQTDRWTDRVNPIYALVFGGGGEHIKTVILKRAMLTTLYHPMVLLFF